MQGDGNKQKITGAEPLPRNPVKWRVVEWDCNSQGSLCRRQKANTHPNQYSEELAETKEQENISWGIEIDLSDDIDDSNTVWKNHAIIARVVGPKFPRKIIRSWIDENWGKHIIIKFLPKNFFVAIFADGSERDRTLGLKNWFLNEHPLYLQPWMPNFDPTTLAVYEKPIWIRLYNLPIEYWNESCLEKIGRTLGTLLELDEEIIENDLYTYARMKVAAIKLIPSSIFLFSANGDWEQHIEVEKDIIAYAKCGTSKTHNVDRCRIYVRKAHSKHQRKTKQVWRNKMDIPLQKIFLIEGPKPSKNLQSIDSNPAILHSSTDQTISVPMGKDNDKKELVVVNDHLDSCSDKSEDEEYKDELDLIELRCISQFVNILLGNSKGIRGTKSNRTVREERAKEKGL
ncbi:hypothetical protein SUGI_0544530 [Cryptomeria japonica]|nr:hypothetical protein SUGI_0544530 [Cryptomeria japonica]